MYAIFSVKYNIADNRDLKIWNIDNIFIYKNWSLENY